MALMLLSGDRGLGKSSALGELVQCLGLKAGGVVCPGTYIDGRKSAVYWLDLARVAATPTAGHGTAGHRAATQGSSAVPGATVPDGAELMARELPGYTGMHGQPHLDLSDGNLLRYGKWEFIRSALAGADEACLRALAEPSAAIVIVDELGPLELSYGQGYVKTLKRLDELFGSGTSGHSDGFVPKAVIVALRPDLAPLLSKRWPGSSLFELSKENRMAAAASMAAFISSWL